MRTWTLPVLTITSVAAGAQQAPPSYELARRVDASVDVAPASSVAISFPVEVAGAPWMQLVFSDVVLPARASLRIISPRDGAVHELDATTAVQWGNRSAYMNGDALVVEVLAEPGAGPIRVALESVVVGLPALQVSTCGATDDRVLSDDRRVARAMPSGCTAWLIDDCNKGFLSAGHCAGSSNVVAMFRVPLSTSNGTTQMSAPEDQYPFDPQSTQSQNSGVGADWWYFGCFANSNTGLTPYQREGATFALLDVPAIDPTATLRVTGHGFDSSPPNWNYVQQTSTGTWTGLSSTSVDHRVDTQGGNSGSPIFVDGTDFAIAVHTHGGCGVSSGSNHGTAIGQTQLQNALANPRGVLACGGSWSTYCTAKVNSQGCTPSVSVVGNPSFAGGPGSCVIRATNVLNNQNGIFFYGTTPAAIPFQGGTLCVAGGLVRTPIQSAGGNPPPADCSGTYAYDLGARIASGADPRLVRGATIVGQFWSRDPSSPSYPSGLTNAVRLTIGP